MQEYMLHKTVKAVQIDSFEIENSDGGCTIVDVNSIEHKYNKDIYSRWVPINGDYLVVCDNGCASIFSKIEFEIMYTLSANTIDADEIGTKELHTMVDMDRLLDIWEREYTRFTNKKGYDTNSAIEEANNLIDKLKEQFSI